MTARAIGGVRTTLLAALALAIASPPSGAAAGTAVFNPFALATTSVTTDASAATALGSGIQLTDEAKVTGRVTPLAGATVTFRLYGPADPSCTASPVFTSPPVSYPVGGGYVMSPGFSPMEAGTHRWIASYSGDANNSGSSGFCGEPSELTTVSKASPTISATASSATTLGSGALLTDSATLTGRVSPQPGAVVTFRLYGPNDAACTGGPVLTSQVSQPAADGPVTSGGFAPSQAGTYRWTVSYTGDANNQSISTACNAAQQSVIVTKASPSMSTTASGTMTIGAPGQQLNDTAVVSGRVSPQAGGTITFRLYGPTDPSCAGSPVFAPTAVSQPPVDGAVQSPSFTPTQAGTYRWTASYSGDANNQPAVSGCNAPNESTVVDRATPVITGVASPAIALGSGTLTDSASVTGRFNPTAGATIDFRLFGPNDASCSGPAVFTTLGMAYSTGGGTVVSAAFDPPSAGTYRWVATYNSNDTNNNSVSTACADVAQTVVVARRAPTITAQASSPTALGLGALTDVATVTGRHNPKTGATISFAVYGPGDTDCTDVPVFISTVPYPAEGGPVSSAPYSPIRAGVHRWIATYSGDANNLSVRTACDDPDQSTAVARATPSLVPTPSPRTTLGSPLTDTASVLGRVSPSNTATIDFRLYGPGDPGCSGTPVFTALAMAYPASGGPVTSPPPLHIRPRQSARIGGSSLTAATRTTPRWTARAVPPTRRSSTAYRRGSTRPRPLA